MAGEITSEQWDRVSELFEAALELTSDRRQAFLDSVCEDCKIRAWVQSLLVQHEQAGDFLQEPLSERRANLALELLDVPAYGESDLLANRFEIKRLIGRGGMGEVYEAWDRELAERVALKVIRKEFANDDATLTRFRREIRLARHITHPNVCRVFDLVRHELPSGQTAFFYVMELVNGETLAQRLARGPISLEQAALLAMDMAGGLDAAHRAGVIHRDFKPGNVMLTQLKERVHAIITDFGLAASAEPDSGGGASTQTSKLLGTPGYIAPEQMVGGPVSKAVDIYAFGVVLRELVGMPAGEDSQSRFAPNWIKAVRGCTALDPKRRFSTATEACRRLSSAPSRYNFSRRQIALSALATAGVSLSALGLRLYRRRSDWKPGARVLVAKTQNLSGEPWLEAFSTGLSVQLGQSTTLNLVEPPDVQALYSQIGKPAGEARNEITPQVWREIAWRSGAEILVFSAISRIGVNYSLTVEYEMRGNSPAKPSSSGIRSFSVRDSVALLAAAGDASGWLRSEAGEAVRSIAQYERPPEDVSTPSWEALSYYARAEETMAQYRYPDSLTLLDSALGRDPQFTLAATRKGDVLMSLQKYDQGLQQWSRAIEMLAKRSLTRREEVYVRGMYAYDTGDLNAAQRHFEAWALEFPQDWRGFFYQTMPLILSGHAADAVRNLERVLQLNPRYNRTWAQLANCYIAMAEWQEAKHVIGKLRAAGEAAHSIFKDASLRFAQGDVAGSREAFRTLQDAASPSWRARAYIYQAVVDLESGDYQLAASRFREEIDRDLPREADTYRSQWRLTRAFAYWRLNDAKPAYEQARAALEYERGPYVLAHAGALFARTGHLAAAAQLVADIRDRLGIPKYVCASHKISGELAKAKGDREAAARHFREASALEPKFAYRNYLATVLPAASAGPGDARDLMRKSAGMPWLVFLDPLRHEPGVLRDARRALETAG